MKERVDNTTHTRDCERRVHPAIINSLGQALKIENSSKNNKLEAKKREYLST
jgi:hypothetical protein